MQPVDVQSLCKAVAEAARTAVSEAFNSMRLSELSPDIDTEHQKQPHLRSIRNLNASRPMPIWTSTPIQSSGKLGMLGFDDMYINASQSPQSISIVNAGSPDANNGTATNQPISGRLIGLSSPLGDMSFSPVDSLGKPKHDWLFRHRKPHNTISLGVSHISPPSTTPKVMPLNGSESTSEATFGLSATTGSRQSRSVKQVMLPITPISDKEHDPTSPRVSIESDTTALRGLLFSFHRILGPIVNSIYFDFGACLLVFCHAVMVGIHAEVVSRQGNAVWDTPEFDAWDSIFCSVFIFELCLRVLVNGTLFFYMPGWQWNVFDCCVVASQVVEEIIKASGEARFSILRMVRILRLLRAIRTVHVMRLGWMATRELRTMMTSIVSSFKFLCWTVVLLGFIIYIVSIYFTHVVADRLTSGSACINEDCEQLRWYFGTFGRTALTLFQSISGGVDWDDVISPLSQHVSPLLGFLFLVYVVSAVLAFLNVTTGVFVEASIKSAKADRDFFIINNVRELFKTQSNGHCTDITWNSFVGLLNTPEMHAYFKAIDLDPSEARGLFRLLDLDDSGTIDAEEFFNGCLRLRGPAKALDMALVMHAMRHMHKQIEANLLQCEANLTALQADVQPAQSPTAAEIASKQLSTASSFDTKPATDASESKDRLIDTDLQSVDSNNSESIATNGKTGRSRVESDFTENGNGNGSKACFGSVAGLFEIHQNRSINTSSKKTSSP